MSHTLRYDLTAAILDPASGYVVATAQAGILARIDQSARRMWVYVGSALAYDRPVSAVRAGYVTPDGHYGVGRMGYSHA